MSVSDTGGQTYTGHETLIKNPHTWALGVQNPHVRHPDERSQGGREKILHTEITGRKQGQRWDWGKGLVGWRGDNQECRVPKDFADYICGLHGV